MFKQKKGTSKSKYNIYIADILNNLGLIHCSLNRFYEAEEEYKNALNEFRILHQEDSNTYSHNIAMSQKQNIKRLWRFIENYQRMIPNFLVIPL